MSSPGTGLRKRRRGLILAVLAVAVVSAAPAAWWLHRMRLKALFSGPSEEKRETRSGFYPTLVYDLRDYLKEDEGEAEAAKQKKPSLFETRESEEDRIRKRSMMDVHQGFELADIRTASKVSWFKSATVYRAQWVPRFLTVTYPPEGAVFPPNLCSPFVEWSDVHNDLWEITVTVGDASLEWTALSTRRTWRFPDGIWEKVKEHAAGRGATLVVKGIRRSGWWSKEPRAVHRSQPVTFHISNDPADNAVLYQYVDPPFTEDKPPSLFVRDIRRKEHKVFLNSRQQYCMNCHTWSSPTGSRGKLGFQVRYRGSEPQEYRSYFVLYDIDRQQGRRLILPFDIQLSTYSAWSPDGTKLAIAARHQYPATRGPLVFETQNLSQVSDIAVYRVADDTASLVPGASDPDVVESYPRWTPDGGSIVYAWTEAGKHPTETQYDLRIVPYNGGRGGTSKPVPGASQNGRSNYFPRFSPDGKWLSWVQATHGSLIKASSDIYIMPSSLDGNARPLECNTPYTADSWHSWSSNSRWIVFTTKRENGIWSRLYLTHIDDDGHASPAVRLPPPGDSTRMSMSIPEFLANVPPIDERRLFEGMGINAPKLITQLSSVEANEPEPR